ncbi:MAG: hypothetical protein Q8918_14465 [Bacteroidota bacterium]|nr:hypothetical protein [Bacteroidota bacterium]
MSSRRTFTGELVLTSQDSIDILTKNRAGLASDSRFLLSFINRRYHQHFKKEHMDVKARIDYILGREKL